MKNYLSQKILLICLMLFGFNSFVFSQGHEVNAIREGRWPASTDGTTYIPVCWENSNGFSTETQWVRSAIESTWEHYAKIDFSGWGACTQSSRGMRILIKDDRSKSHMGRYMDGRYGGMELNFTFKNFSREYCWDKQQHCVQAIAVHEFGHALGLGHEQDRTDSLCYKDQDLTVGRYVSLAPFDQDSVMNYCNPKWNNNGNLSYYDIDGIQKIYGKKTATNTGTNTVVYGSISVFDELGDDQVWEEVRVSLQGTVKSLTLSKTQRRGTLEWSFSQTGTYCFKFSTKALHTNGTTYQGYGEQCYNLTGGTRYSSLAMERKSWNEKSYFNLILK